MERALMQNETVRRIEFFGGPLDGYVGSYCGPRKPFVAIKPPVAARAEGLLRTFLRVLFFHDHLHSRVHSELTAFYELRCTESGHRYFYLRSYSESQLDLKSEFVDTGEVDAGAVSAGLF